MKYDIKQYKKPLKVLIERHLQCSYGIVDVQCDE